MHFKKISPFLRFFTTSEEGGGSPHGEPGEEIESGGEGSEIDYRAKYEAAISESRKWEQRSKANKEKADAFDKAEAEKLTETEKLNAALAAAESRAGASEAELLQLRAANKHGITAKERALLTATSEDALEEQVASIIALRAPETAPAANAGVTSGGDAAPVRAKDLNSAVAARIKTN